MADPVKLVASLSTKTAFPGVRLLERQRGRPYKARLGSNECLFGTPPAAIKAALAATDVLGLYNDPRCFDLIEAICETGGHDPATVLAGIGIDGLLGLLVRGFLEPGATAVTTRGSYPTFNYHVAGYGGRLTEVPYTAAFHSDLDGMLDAIKSHRARVCYISNPDNPTGTFLAKDEIARFADAVPGDCLILLDEAYIEFVPGHLVLPLLFKRPNLVRLRTFSKAYGLASARVGYMTGHPDIVSALNRIRLHFGVGTLSQVMARAALGDLAFLKRVIAATATGRADIERIARGASIACLPSHANFVALDFGMPERAIRAAAVMEEYDVFVRRPPEPGVGSLMRVTVGPEPARALFAEALEAAVRHA